MMLRQEMRALARMTAKGFVKVGCLLVLILLVLPGGPVHATEPLVDRITMDGESGIIYPDECCGLELPRNGRLRALAASEAENCTAIGDPVGQFELRDRLLWLTELRVCGGELPLPDLYPGQQGPMAARWLNGTFHVGPGFECYRNNTTGRVYRIEARLDVQDGEVVKMTRKPTGPCAEDDSGTP